MASEFDDVIIVEKRKIELSKFVDSLTVIPSFEIVKYLKTKEVKLPKYFHRSLIKKMVTLDVYSRRKTAELSDKYKYFDDFTIFQLEHLANDFNIDIDVTEYKRDFWNVFIRNRHEFNMNDLEFVRLDNLIVKYTTAPQESYTEFKTIMKELLYEPKGYFDGVPIETVKKSLSEVATIQELKDLGSRYGIDVPRRISKEELIEFIGIVIELDANEKMLLESMSALEVERYARDKDISMSIDLKKQDMVQYILSNLSEDYYKNKHGENTLFKKYDFEEYLFDLKFNQLSKKIKGSSGGFSKILVLTVFIVLVAVVGLHFAGVLPASISDQIPF